MIAIGEFVFEAFDELLGALFWRGFHATGRRLVFWLALVAGAIWLVLR